MPPINLIQKRIANISVGSSTVRGQPKGTVKIQEFSNMKEDNRFQNLLDNHTLLLKEKLPSKSWGIARKVLNIFMFQASRDILLNRKYSLDGIISYLELPLDNPNAKRLVKFAKSKDIRLNWRNIYSLDAETNKQFQVFAKHYAHDTFQCDRCYLDVYWWRSEE